MKWGIPDPFVLSQNKFVKFEFFELCDGSREESASTAALRCLLDWVKIRIFTLSILEK